MSVATFVEERPVPCRGCAEELFWSATGMPGLTPVDFSHDGNWDVWRQELVALLNHLVNSPVHVLVLDVPGGRCVQVQLGHGRCVVEVSSSTRSTRDGVTGESIASELIDAGFASPVDFRDLAADSPAWSLELEPVSPAPLAAFITAVLRDLMSAEVGDVTVSGFVLERPCARCHRGPE